MEYQHTSTPHNAFFGQQSRKDRLIARLKSIPAENFTPGEWNPSEGCGCMMYHLSGGLITEEDALTKVATDNRFSLGFTRKLMHIFDNTPVPQAGSTMPSTAQARAIKLLESIPVGEDTTRMEGHIRVGGNTYAAYLHTMAHKPWRVASPPLVPVAHLSVPEAVLSLEDIGAP